ncbi:hypothetical protein PSTT_00859 [Puccinia striiformis]|uniref:Uncharacterized protein n=2 Tax=Puccinia striiformis TaxID=27350 RepID=A0A0L0URK9_9BASI|nr:hypothetical protein PSTG_16943 [Puccinia striiformis f. sp. tritici PST-78]POW16991.1 hypothetical protein PSTT_00859 [Puccinia striiformis]
MPEDLLPGPPPPPIKDQIKLVNCGIVFYQLDKLKRTDDVSSNLPTANDPHTSLVPASDIPLPKTPTSCLTRSAALATQSGALAPLLYRGLMPDEHLEVLLVLFWPAELLRLKFNHNNLGGQQSAYQARYDQHLKASTLPLTIKVKKTTIIGQGSMRKAYLALVKTDGQNGGPP